MQIFRKSSRIQTLLLFILVSVTLLACRTYDLVMGYPVPPASQLVAQARPLATPEPAVEAPPSTSRPPLPTQVPTRAPTDSFLTELAPTEEPPPLPTDVLLPTDEPFIEEPPPTSAAAAAGAPQPTPVDAGPTATPAPTRCPQQFCVVYRGCQPDSGNTVIEGFVYNNGVPENDVVVRVAKEPGAFPLVDDFVTGSSAINPGQPDPNTPGYYILQIVAGAPREGNWWVFVVDRVNGTKQLSEAQLIHTNDDPFNPVNCQRAFVDFVR